MPSTAHNPNRASSDLASLTPTSGAPGDFVGGGTIATSPLWIGPIILNQNAKAFGVVIALFAYILIVVTISMVCAVFGLVWAERRQSENDRKG